MQLELVVARSRLYRQEPDRQDGQLWRGGREREEEEDLVYSVSYYYLLPIRRCRY